MYTYTHTLGALGCDGAGVGVAGWCRVLSLFQSPLSLAQSSLTRDVAESSLTQLPLVPSDNLAHTRNPKPETLDQTRNLEP